MDMHFTENIDYKIKDLKLYSDSRGALFEALRFKSEKIPNGGQIYVYSVMPGFRRGIIITKEKENGFVVLQVRLLY